MWERGYIRAGSLTPEWQCRARDARRGGCVAAARLCALGTRATAPHGGGGRAETAGGGTLLDAVVVSVLPSRIEVSGWWPAAFRVVGVAKGARGNTGWHWS